MKFTPTSLPEVILIDPVVFKDPRGFFFENYHLKKFTEGGIPATFVQDNHSRSVKSTLRGLHFQVNQPQGKLVRAVRGEVFDVAVDIRVGSPRFKQWTGVVFGCATACQTRRTPGCCWSQWQWQKHVPQVACGAWNNRRQREDQTRHQLVVWVLRPKPG